MVEFKELRVTPDGSKLIVEVAVIDLPYYENVFIDAIVIDNQDTYVPDGPSENPLYFKRIEDNLNIITKEITGEKWARLEIESKDIGTITGNLFFVYVIAKGVPTEDTPCGMDNIMTTGVVANLYPFYRSTIYDMKGIENDCIIPKRFIDKILRFKALTLSIRTGHYTQAIKYWNKFFVNIKDSSLINKCSCK